MRNAICQALKGRFLKKRFIFLTGDLGFMALEPLKDVMGDRFINAGISEQNMVSVSAGLAMAGEEVWAYSIAPFLYARPFEQIRNDICIHGLPVKLIGNGGGYGYGSMGATHHALEDYGVLLGLQGMTVFAPAFTEDVDIVTSRAVDIGGPAYLRLGRGEKPQGAALPEYAPWRKLVDGAGPVILAVGPIAGGIWDYIVKMVSNERPALWVVSELPLEKYPPPKELIADINISRRLIIVEEHVAHGGVGQMMAAWLLGAGCPALKSFDHLCAKGYPSGLYGSQTFHRRECGLDPSSVGALWDKRRGEDGN